MSGVEIGPQAKILANQRDAERQLKVAERRSSCKSREARMARKDEKIVREDLFEEVEGILYDPETAD